MFNGIPEVPIGFNQTTFDKNIVVQHGTQGIAAGFDGGNELQRIEDDAFVYAVLRIAAVDYAAADGQQIALFGNQVLVVEVKVQFSADDADNFGFLMPVHGHTVARKRFIHEIVIQRKIAGFMGNLFMVIQIMHGKTSQLLCEYVTIFCDYTTIHR